MRERENENVNMEENSREARRRMDKDRGGRKEDLRDGGVNVAA